MLVLLLKKRIRIFIIWLYLVFYFENPAAEVLILTWLRAERCCDCEADYCSLVSLPLSPPKTRGHFFFNFSSFYIFESLGLRRFFSFTLQRGTCHEHHTTGDLSSRVWKRLKMPHGPLHRHQCASSGHPKRRITKKCRGLASGGSSRWCWFSWSAALSSSASISSTTRPSSSAPGRRSAMHGAERASTAGRWTQRSALWCCRTPTSWEPSGDTGSTSWGGKSHCLFLILLMRSITIATAPSINPSEALQERFVNKNNK